jgi:hypothetical protein
VSAEDARTAPSELVSGFLAVLSLAASALALFWDPLRVSPFAILLALIATAMAPRDARDDQQSDLLSRKRRLS